MNQQKFHIGDKVNVQTLDWESSIINELNNDMVFVTTRNGLGRDVHKSCIREHLFGDILTKFPKHKPIIVVTNYPCGIVHNVFENSCYVKFIENPVLDRNFNVSYLKKMK